MHPNNDSVLFISDLHLSQHAPDLQALFQQFLAGPAQSAKQLYILGDLFDIWVGKDIHTAFQARIQQALQQLSAQGVELFFMAGNRDFLICPQFLKAAGCKLLKDPCVIDLHGIPTLLTHGDLLCTQDIAYQRFRRIVRLPLTRFLFLRMTKNWREKTGQKLRARSQRYQRQQTLSILDAVPETVEKMMQKFKVPQMIHGHVHRPRIHEVAHQKEKAKRVVLGDWHRKASFIISTPANMALATYCPEAGVEVVDSYEQKELGLIPV